MTCSSCSSTVEKFGATPANIQWSVVRGDTATLSISFLESDEVTGFDCSTWTYEATAYDIKGDVLDSLLVDADGSTVIITAPSSMTANWGTKYLSVVAELPFDLQVRIPGEGEDTVWTPLIGTIRVLGDITPGGSL